MVRGGLAQLMTLIRGPYLRTRMGVMAVLCILVLSPWFGSADPDYTRKEILEAIWMTETSGRLRPPDGDGGRAIGPFQIHKIYWIDSAQPGEYQDCRRRAYAERVVEAYMLRYVPEAWMAGDAEIIARTHNGGPRGRFKRATDRYWERVSKWLQKLPRQAKAGM